MMSGVMFDSAVDIPAIRFQQVGKSYGDFEALRSVTFDVPQGSFFAILGSNGAGKSTLINSLAGLVKPTTGAIEVLGCDVQTDFQQARRLLGLVPQELIAEPFFNIEQLLRFQSGYFDLPDNDEWIEFLLDQLALSDKRHQLTHTLSGGMKRRLLIAMGLVHKPQVIVLDEPTAGVDIELRKHLWAFATRLHEQGHTIVLTTHYLEEAQQLCDRVAILHQGRLVSIEDTSTLLKRYPYKQVHLRCDQPVLSWPEPWQGRLNRSDDEAGYQFTLPIEESLQSLLQLLNERQVGVLEVHIAEPSLEQVFEHVIGDANTQMKQSVVRA